MIEELEPGIYELTVFDDNNCENTFSFDVTEAFNECLVIPNTFTPNGDNYNDTWVLGNINLYPSATVKVFNKWGNEIFSNNDGTYDPWDGSHNGQPLPSGVYYYIIILNNEQNNQYTGTVTIVR
jgi:gliding motility-associated-like protein